MNSLHSAQGGRPRKGTLNGQMSHRVIITVAPFEMGKCRIGILSSVPPVNWVH